MLTFASLLVYNSFIKNKSELEEEYEQVSFLWGKWCGKEWHSLL